MRWLSERGHFAIVDEGCPEQVQRALFDEACDALEMIYTDLAGDPAVLEGGRRNPLRGDFEHVPTGTLVEVDELQHFTSFRRRTLELYPERFPLGFDRIRYFELCEQLSDRADRYRKAKEARGFGDGGRQRQRAYYDALRDLATPAMGRPALVRVEALNDDGEAAYRAKRDELRQLLSQPERRRPV